MNQFQKILSMKTLILLAFLPLAAATVQAEIDKSEESPKSEKPLDPDAPVQAVNDLPESSTESPERKAEMSIELNQKGSDNPVDSPHPELPATVTEEKIAVPARQNRKLSVELYPLRDQVRKTLSQHARQPFNTRQNTVTEVLDYCLSYGCNTEITLTGSSGGKRENAIACLCWNIPCAGYEPLKLCDDRIVARLGHGKQMRPSQFLAMLAFARVQPSYPLRVGEIRQTVADLVELEKQQCRTGADLSMTLVGLSYYSDTPSWKNDIGEQWSLERMIMEELDQPAQSTQNGGLDRLLGLVYAVNHREQHNSSIDGQFARAKKYLDEMHTFALSLQNPDGSWGYFLTGRGRNPDENASLRSTAHVMEWLAISFPEQQLEDARLIAGIKYLQQSINTNRSLKDISSLATREINSYTHALHALSLYNDRCFQSVEEEKVPAKPKAQESVTTRANLKAEINTNSVGRNY
jgi:hypothetical protein